MTKNNMLKKTIAFSLTLAMAMSAFPAIGLASAESFYEDFEDEYQNTFTVNKDGSVFVMGDDENKYLNISPKSDGISAFAEYKFECDDTVPVRFSYRFKINDIMQSGQTIAYVSKEGQPSIVIETYDGGLAYKNSAGNYVKFLNSVVANKWYDISIKADYTKSTFSIRLDGKDVVTGARNIGASKGADKISFRAKYSPGIAIDDFSTGVTQNPGKVEITGDSEIKLAYNSAAEFDYFVAIYDTNDAEIDALSYTASVIPAGAGISVALNGRKVTLSVNPDAEEGDYTLRVIYGSAIRNFHFKLNRYSAQAESVSLEGPGRIAYLKDKDNTYSFKATALDQNGEKCPDVAFNYFLEGDNSSNIGIDSTTGVVTVTGELKNNTRITITAECADNTSISASKQVLLQDEETYIGDETRFRVLLDAVDRSRLYGRDPYNGSILLAKAIDRYTMKPAIWNGLEYDFVPSNLAEQGNWFRTMQGLYNLTGDEQYKREIDETYDMYLDNYIYDNGTISMGGHICIDLKTLLPHHGYGSNTLELKNHFPYMEPLWEKDPEAARRFAIMFWEGAVTNWKSLAFNRHINVYDTYTESNWNQYETYKKPEQYGLRPVPSNGVSFRATAVDLISQANEIYKHTGEEAALEWGYNLLTNYYACTDNETKINTDVFNSRYHYKNNNGWGYDADLTVPEYWWTTPKSQTETTASWWGDRFDVPNYEEMVKQGFIKPVNRRDGAEIPMSLEPFYRNSVSSESMIAYADLELAELFGFDSEKGDMILDYTLTSLRSLYKYGNYSPADNKIDQLLVDGTSLNGYHVKRGGYHNSKGTVMGRFSITPDFTLANLKTYDTCKDLVKYQDQLYYIWQFIRGDMAYNGFGEVGITKPGDNTKLDYSTISAEPRYLVGFCWLYDISGEVQYLEMARRIANNIINSSMVNGMFTYQPSSHYIEIAGRNSIYYYAFALLEATIRGETDAMPQYFLYGGYYEDRGILENTNERRTNLHDTNMWNRYNVTAVHITDIIVAEEEINMKVGEEKSLNISFEPDDATNKSVRITSSNPACVWVDESEKTIVANKPGSVEIRIISANNKQLRKTITVNVE